MGYEIHISTAAVRQSLPKGFDVLQYVAGKYGERVMLEKLKE